MTNGTRTRDDRVSVPTGTYDLDGNKVNSSTALKGYYYQRVWTGADYPPVKPTYKKYVVYPRDGSKPLTFRQRTDIPTRRKTADHAYTATINESNVGAYDNKVGTRNPIWPYGPGDYVTSYSGQFGVVSGDTLFFQQKWTSNDDLALLGKLRDQIGGNGFNAGVMLGEGRQALKLITESSTKIYKTMQALKFRGPLAALAVLNIRNFSPVEKKTWVASSQNMANGWLQMVYGVKPLLQDTHDAVEFLAAVLEFPLVRTYRVRRVVPAVGYETNPTWTASASGYTQKQLIARLEEVNPYKLAGLLDPASVAWELLPWSFVYDWFIPIGNYLQARGLASSLTGTFVTTTKVRQDKLWTGYSPIRNPNQFGTPSVGNTYRKLITIDRSVSTSLSVPMPAFKPLGKVASWQHCANAVALLTSQSGKWASRG